MVSQVKAGRWDTRGMSVAEKLEFFSRLDKDTGCINWIGSGSNGYGRMSWNGETYSATRFSYEEKFGPSDRSLDVCHTCDNPSCINPDHLFLGTAKDNAKDMVSKGRNKFVPAPGSRNGNALLTEAIVKAIREDAGTHKSIAKKYGIHRADVTRIKSRRAWTHVPMDGADTPPEHGLRWGEKHGMAILTADQVREIRRLQATTKMTGRSIAAHFGVSEYAISDIKRRKSWALLE